MSTHSTFETNHAGTNHADTNVRIDKWLWAARFFKTRALAKKAIEGGKVSMNGQRCKVSKMVTLGAVMTIRQGLDEKDIVVKGLSDQRRGAPEAQTLYEETPDSIKRRMDRSEQRKLFNQHHSVPDHKPNKKERRDLERFHHQYDQ